MTVLRVTQLSLSDAFDLSETPDGVSVTTHCMYPSNAFVRVVVRGGIDSFHVSDEGGAVREIEAAGAEIENPDRLLRHWIRGRGLQLQNGVISSPEVGRDAIL